MSLLENVRDKVDLLIKFTYLVPALSIILSVLYTWTYWWYLKVDIVDYINIGHLLITSIEIFVYIVLIVLVGSIVMYTIDYITGLILKVVNAYIFLSLLVISFGYFIYLSEDRLLLIAFITAILVFTLIVTWLLKGVIFYKLAEFIEDNVQNIESTEQIKTESFKNKLLSKLLDLTFNTIILSFVIVLIFLIPILFGLQEAKNVDQKISYSYVNAENFKGELTNGVDRYILLGKVGDNYFFRPDTINSVLIKQISDFKNLEIKKVNEGDSLSSVSFK